MEINERPINPKVSVWTKDWFPKKGDELKQMDLYTVMKQCERISSSAEKGKSGSIFPYLSDEVNPYTLVFDGVVFVDIDNCQEVSYKIFDSFDKICGEMPNLLAMNFSYSINGAYEIRPACLNGNMAERDTSSYTHADRIQSSSQFPDAHVGHIGAGPKSRFAGNG